MAAPISKANGILAVDPGMLQTVWTTSTPGIYATLFDLSNLDACTLTLLWALDMTQGGNHQAWVAHVTVDVAGNNNAGVLSPPMPVVVGAQCLLRVDSGTPSSPDIYWEVVGL